MNLHSAFKTSYLGLKAKKSRSILTILGIVIGITAIILIMSLGKGAQDLIIGQVQAIGSKTIGIIPGKQMRGPSDFAQMASDSLKERDVEALKKKENVPNLSKIMPVVFGTQTGAYGSETYNFSIFGVTSLAQSIYDLEMQSGYFLSDDDVKSYASVVVIGDKIKKELFGLDDPVGQKMKIKGMNFRVIGVIKSKGAGALINFDDIAMMPYTTAQQYVLGIKHYNRIAVEADKEENVPQVVSDIKQTLRESHNITDPSKDDFNIETQADAIETLSVITNVLTYFLTAVAAISLIVGGIGIMNIMLVSVTERTREIGLRKAIGATNYDILVQFLLESILLTIAGGIIGILLGAAFSFLASIILTQALALNWSFIFPVQGALLGLGVSAFIGLIFGLYPAMQAARKNPIDALRYE